MTQNAEQRALRVSVAMNLIMGILGFGFAVWTDSGAIMLDGLFSTLNFFIALVTMRVSRMVVRPADDDFHFGYAHFEPLLNTGKALVMVALSVFAAAGAVRALAHGGRDLSAGPAVLYALLAMVGCFATAGFQARTAKRTQSPLLAVETKSWFIDGLLSGVVAAAFGGAVLLNSSRWSHWVPYVDPLLVVVLVLAILPIPFGIAKKGLGEMLGAAPSPKVQAQIRTQAEPVLRELPVDSWKIRMLEVGRYFYVLIQVLVKKDHPPMDVHELDDIRRRLDSALTQGQSSVIVDSVFTKDKSRLDD